MQHELSDGLFEVEFERIWPLRAMSDCEETDFFWEALISPGRRKRKKDSKKDKKCPKRKNNMATKTDENVQKKKKKKNSKFKEAMEERKEKKKEKKKKKKNRSALEQDGSFVFTQSCNTQAKPTVEPPTQTQDFKKKIKRKKQVAFDLSPAYICVKRPKLVSLSQQSPRETELLEKEAVGGSEGCSQVTVTGHMQGQTHDNDSQCTSDDINSQDLFITQKTFRVSSSQPSSGEASDRVIAATQEEELNTAHENHKKGALSSQMQLNTNLTEEKKASKPRVVNPFLDEPAVVKSKTPACTLNHKSPSCVQHINESSVLHLMSMTSTSTQTENFFTTELSSYLNFCRTSRATVRSEDLKPLDLSLAHRARKGDDCGDSNLHPSSDKKHAEEKREPIGRHPWSVNTQGKDETALSPQSESEAKSADTTTSSEDNEPPCRAGKLDLTQVRAVQTRLNESFFFKTKGDGQSPRPASPLMKLAQSSREVKSRKAH